jgi:alpha 1,2-mannosyltransferase
MLPLSCSYLNDEPFSNEFRAVAAAATIAPAFFGLVPAAHWSYPPHINTTLAAELRSAARRRMPYGGSESYRFMCRYFSGFFFDHPLLERFEWYWRVEPDVHFMCDLPGITHDPFRHMQASNQSLAWTIVVRVARHGLGRHTCRLLLAASANAPAAPLLAALAL